MPSKTTSIRSRVKTLTTTEFYEIIRSTVIKRRAKCLRNGDESSKWFHELGTIAANMSKAVPREQVELSSLLASVAERAEDLRGSTPSSFSKPFTTLLDAIQEQNDGWSEVLIDHFDKLQELIYREEKKPKTQTDTFAFSQQDTVQEFDKVPPLRDDDKAAIGQAIQWSRSLDPDRLYDLLNLSTQQILRYLDANGFSMRELARQLSVTHTGLGYIMRGKRDPSGAIQKKVLLFAVFHMFEE